jgi:hypothetical protein
MPSEAELRSIMIERMSSKNSRIHVTPRDGRTHDCLEELVA